MSIEKLTNLLSATSSWTSRERFKALGHNDCCIVSVLHQNKSDLATSRNGG